MSKRVLVVGLVLISAVASADAGAYYMGGRRMSDGDLYALTNSWTGLYVGGVGGFGWDAGDAELLTANDTDQIVSKAPDASGGFGGGQLGYNWQFGRIVYGLAADIQAGDISDRTSGTAGEVTYANEQELGVFGSARGVLGYSFTDLLLYGTFGFAFGDVTNKIHQVGREGAPGNSVAVLTLEKSSVKTGYTMGGGFEYRLTRSWSFGGEYQHIDLGGETLAGYNTFVPCGVPCPPSYYSSEEIKNAFDVVKLTLNYRFSGAPRHREPPYRPYK